MDLKWLLVRRIALVAAACLLAGAALAIYDTASNARRQNQSLLDLVGRQLDLQLSRIDRSTDVVARFPDWDLIAGLALQPGQCLEWHDVNGAPGRSSCAGVDAASARAPRWFAALYRALLANQLTASRPVAYRGVARGTIVAQQDVVATASQAWAAIAPLLGFAAVLLVALCLVTYVVVDRALRPTREILAGLNRLARGDLAFRLPAFRLAELDRISQVFNALSDELTSTTAERAELARRLVDGREQERRHLARELHDEIAQKLTALNALAACLRTLAQRDAPALADEAREIESMASGLMLSLRRTLSYLRPQEIDDLGLAQSLEALVAQHNETALGRTAYSIEMSSGVEHLRAETSAHVYRIIQEALTNAAKHANARHVRVLLHHIANQGHDAIQLTVVDDGAAAAPATRQSHATGSGIIGMRERVVALSGKFAAGPLPGGGFALQVEFPTLEGGA